MAGKVKGTIVTLAKRKQGGSMTAAELMRHNFDEIFIELDPVKREAMMRNAYTEDCVWIHPGGRLVGIAAVNEPRRKFVSASRSTATRWLAIFARCTMSGCAVGVADFLTNRSAIPVRTFWRNATAVSLCSTPLSIVEPRRSHRRNKAFAWIKTWLTRGSAVAHPILSLRSFSGIFGGGLIEEDEWRRYG